MVVGETFGELSEHTCTNYYHNLLLLVEIYLISVPCVALHFPFSENIVMPSCQILPCIKASKQYSIKVEQFQFLAQKPCCESTTKTYCPRESETFLSLSWTYVVMQAWRDFFYDSHVLKQLCQFAIFSENRIKMPECHRWQLITKATTGWLSPIFILFYLFF